MKDHKRTFKPKHGVAVSLIIIAALLPFIVLDYVGRQSILNEVRHQVMGVAIATAAGIDGGQLETVTGPESIDTPEYRGIQAFLDRIGLANPDVRYIYTMRRARDSLAPAHMMEFVVDQPARDADGDGIISAEEKSEPPGALYDAAELPELQRGFYEASADREVSPDPPYPDLISGYAPVRKADGEVTGIVGVDVTARTIAGKMLFLRTTLFAVWVIISVLLICVFNLFLNQRDAYLRISGLTRELELRNDMLRSANADLAAMNHQFREDLQLAQRVQRGFLPQKFPRHDRIVFDQYYLTCEILGGDLYDVFEIDHDNIGLYIADVAGHGVGAALVSGLLKMTVSTMRQQQPGGTASMFVDLTRPDHFLKVINNLLVKEIPEGEFITFIYGVFNLLENKLVMASAGHPRPIIYNHLTRQAAWCETRNGMPLGIEEGQEYTATEHPVDSGDLVLFYTDGLTEAMNARREEFGEERLLSLVGLNDVNNASQLNDLIRQAVERHRDGEAVSDDFTLLTVELR